MAASCVYTVAFFLRPEWDATGPSVRGSSGQLEVSLQIKGLPMSSLRDWDAPECMRPGDRLPGRMLSILTKPAHQVNHTPSRQGGSDRSWKCSRCFSFREARWKLETYSCGSECLVKLGRNVVLKWHVLWAIGASLGLDFQLYRYCGSQRITVGNNPITN